MHNLWTDMALKGFFFECLYFSEYDIRMYLFVFWLRHRPSVKYVSTQLGEWRGDHQKCVQVRTQGGELKSLS